MNTDPCQCSDRGWAPRFDANYANYREVHSRKFAQFVSPATLSKRNTNVALPLLCVAADVNRRILDHEN